MVSAEERNATDADFVWGATSERKERRVNLVSHGGFAHCA